MKTIQRISDNSETFKALYFDRERQALRPNLVFVNHHGEIHFETNELGLKGDPLDPNRKLAVVWGDSVVFSVAHGWPCLLDRLAPGWQFLNGGLDGDRYTNVLARARELNKRQPVALNVLMPGWHPLIPQLRRDQRWGARLWRALTPELPRVSNRGLRKNLTAFIRDVPNPVLVTMPTALNPNILDQDLSPYLVEGSDADVRFGFLGVLTYSVELQRAAYEHIVERNAIVRDVAAQTGVPLVDFFKLFDTIDAADFRGVFYDILHFRPKAYPLVAQTLYEAIKPLLLR